MSGHGRLIVARHGSYSGSSGLLDAKGVQQMQFLARLTQNAWSDGGMERLVLLCSTAPRAKHGGEIISSTLNVQASDVHYHDCLWNDDYHRGDFNACIDLVKNFVQDGVLVVVITHAGYVQLIAECGHKAVFDQSYNVRTGVMDIGYGEAMIVNGEQPPCIFF